MLLIFLRPQCLPMWGIFSISFSRACTCNVQVGIFLPQLLHNSIPPNPSHYINTLELYPFGQNTPILELYKTIYWSHLGKRLALGPEKETIYCIYWIYFSHLRKRLALGPDKESNTAHPGFQHHRHRCLDLAPEYIEVRFIVTIVLMCVRKRLLTANVDRSEFFWSKFRNWFGGRSVQSEFQYTC